MSELSRDARTLIETSRASAGPSERDKERVRERLVAELGVGAFALASSAALSSTQTGAGLAKLTKIASAWWVKGVAVAALAGGSAAYVTSAPVTSSAPRAAREHAPPVAHEARPAHAASLLARAEVTLLDERAHDEPLAFEAGAVRAGDRQAPRAQVGTERRAHRSRARAQATDVVRDAAPASTVSAELALLGQAQRALREGRAQAALELAREHAQRFPAGALHEEQRGIETLARCLLGERPEASARAFLERAPSSPLAARVRKECGVP